MQAENVMTEALVNKATGEVLEIGLQKSPDEIMQDAQLAANALEKLLSNNKRPPLEFRGQRYLEISHWQTIAKFFHTGVATGEAVYIELDGKKGFKAHAQVIDEKTGIVVGGADAFCMNDEAQWKVKPMAQMASMAQTRAASKALSNRYKYVAIVAGFEPTTAEEMEVSAKPEIQPPQEKPIEFGENKPNTLLTEKQQKMLYARCSTAGITPELAKVYMRENFGLASSQEMTWQQLDKMLKWVDDYKKLSKTSE